MLMLEEASMLADCGLLGMSQACGSYAIPGPAQSQVLTVLQKHGVTN